METKISQETINALNAQHLESIDASIKSINEKLDKTYATKEELNHVDEKVFFMQKIVYGAVSFVLLAFMAGVVYVVIPRGSSQTSSYIKTSTQQ